MRIILGSTLAYLIPSFDTSIPSQNIRGDDWRIIMITIEVIILYNNKVCIEVSNEGIKKYNNALANTIIKMNEPALIIQRSSEI